jgi:hypothetical protein
VCTYESHEMDSQFQTHETTLSLSSDSQTHICGQCMVYPNSPWSGSVGVTNQLAWVQYIGSLAITRAMCTTASDIMELHVNLLPIELLLNKICFTETMQLSTLPSQHPLYKPLWTCTKTFIKRHRSPLHYPTHIFNTNPNDIVTITTNRQHLSRQPY